MVVTVEVEVVLVVEGVLVITVVAEEVGDNWRI